MTTETPAFIDALSYIDTAIDDDEDQRVIAMKLVDDEIDLFPPERDYLEYLPAINKPRTFETQLIKNEHQCIENNLPRTSSTELSQIRTEIPPCASSMMDADELAIWSKCLNQIKVKIEYIQRQMVNLDLLKIYGIPTWEQFLAEIESMEAALKQELELLEKKTREVNWNRSREQERISKTLEVLKNEWNSLMDKNRILSDEINKIGFKI